MLTESGLKKIKDELDYLKNVKRKEAAENVGIARSFGDLSENSEYDEERMSRQKSNLKFPNSKKHLLM